LTFSKRSDYSTDVGQKDKFTTMKRAEQRVLLAKKLLEKTGLFETVVPYRPESTEVYIQSAPAIYVNTPKGRKLVIAPDLRCILLNNSHLWIEVKDKPQRFLYPDTGCDTHQYIGYWSVNKFRHEPVLMLFNDLFLEEMTGLTRLPRPKREDFIRRCRPFAPDDKPVFYGNWMTILASFDEKTQYPKCFHERSRDMSMKIVYMDVTRMIPFLDN
jgi:hypothetical protein